MKRKHFNTIGFSSRNVVNLERYLKFGGCIFGLLSVISVAISGLLSDEGQLWYFTKPGSQAEQGVQDILDHIETNRRMDKEEES